MIKTTLRIPEDLHARIIATAERDRRSLNSQILFLIERGLGDNDRSEPGAAPPPAGRP